jgi:hypothetical protein
MHGAGTKRRRPSGRSSPERAPSYYASGNVTKNFAASRGRAPARRALQSHFLGRASQPARLLPYLPTLPPGKMLRPLVVQGLLQIGLLLIGALSLRIGLLSGLVSPLRPLVYRAFVSCFGLFLLGPVLQGLFFTGPSISIGLLCWAFFLLEASCRWGLLIRSV